MPSSRVLCLYGAKGGIGKTTLAINLAGVLANMNKSVLIIDLNQLNGDIAVSLDRKPHQTIAALAAAIKTEKYQGLLPYLTKYNQYISFLAAPAVLMPAEMLDAEVINKILDEAAALFEVVIIDMSHAYNDVNLAALKRADKNLFVTTNNPLTLKNTRNVLSLLKEAGVRNIEVLLNNSIHPNHDYFVLYDIKNIIQAHIDYIISQRFYYPDIDLVTVAGEILTLKSRKWPDYKIFTLIIESLLK